MANAAEQWVTVATGLTEARVNELALVLTARGVPFQRQPGACAAGSSGCRSPMRRPPPPSSRSIATRTRARSARGRSRRSATGRAGVVWYVATLLAVFFALHADLFNRDWLGAGRLEAGAAARRRVVARRHGADGAPRARSLGRQPRVRRVLRLLRRPLSRHGRRLARGAARGRRAPTC